KPEIRVKNLLIYGYADHLGTTNPNKELAEERALNVRDVLLRKGISEKKILICSGVGEIKNSKNVSDDGVPTDRKVVIFIKRNRPSKTAIVSKTKEETSSMESSILSLKSNQTLVMDNLLFHTEKHKLIPESVPELKRLLAVLLKHPELKIRIEGHVCCVPYGVDALDIETGENKLSENRAKYIYDYLVAYGVPRENLSYIGIAKTSPLVDPEESNEDRQKNRRVEIRIID